MSTTTSEYPFGPPPQIFDPNATYTTTPSLPFNTTDHLFSSDYPAHEYGHIHTNSDHSSKKRKRASIESNPHRNVKRCVQNNFDHAYDSGNNHSTHSHINNHKSHYYKSQSRNKKQDTSYHSTRSRTRSRSRSRTRSRSHSQMSFKNIRSPHSRSSHSRSRNRSHSKSSSKHYNSSPKSYYKPETETEPVLGTPELNKESTPMPKSFMKATNKTQKDEEKSFDMNFDIPNIGLTSHSFATNVFSLLPLHHFDQELYFPFSSKTEINNYSELFNINNNTKQLCEQSKLNEKNMNNVYKNVKDYFNEAMTEYNENDNDIIMKTNSKNKDYLPENGYEILQSMMNKLMPDKKNIICKSKVVEKKYKPINNIITNKNKNKNRKAMKLSSKQIKNMVCNFKYKQNEKVLCYDKCVPYNAVILDRKMDYEHDILSNHGSMKVPLYLVHFMNNNNNIKMDKWVTDECILQFNSNINDVNISNIGNISVKNENICNINISNIDNKKMIKKENTKPLQCSKEIIKKQNGNGINMTSTSTNNMNQMARINITNINTQSINTQNIETKIVLDQNIITQTQALKENYLLKQQIINLENELNITQKELEHQKKKYFKKAKKCKEYYQVSKRLYRECIHGEGPRWNLIEMICDDNRIKRDSELQKLKQEINSLYKNISGINVCGIQKWRNRKDIENSIRRFIELNGEYKVNATTFLNGNAIHLRQVIQKFKIDRNHRISALNGQHGIQLMRDVPIYTVFGQYIGGEILQPSFATVFDGTGEEHDHNMYAFDQTIDKIELLKISKKQINIDDIPNKTFIIDPFIGDWKMDELLLKYVNDCRADIDDFEPTNQDLNYYNVEFVGMKVNGWPQTYLIAKRDLKKGEELMTFYGTDFSNAIQSKLEEELNKQERKKRIDEEILQGVKL